MRKNEFYLLKVYFDIIKMYKSKKMQYAIKKYDKNKIRKRKEDRWWLISSIRPSTFASLSIAGIDFMRSREKWDSLD